MLDCKNDMILQDVVNALLAFANVFSNGALISVDKVVCLKDLTGKIRSGMLLPKPQQNSVALVKDPVPKFSKLWRLGPRLICSDESYRKSVLFAGQTYATCGMKNGWWLRENVDGRACGSLYLSAAKNESDLKSVKELMWPAQVLLSNVKSRRLKQSLPICGESCRLTSVQTFQEHMLSNFCRLNRHYSVFNQREQLLSISGSKIWNCESLESENGEHGFGRHIGAVMWCNNS